MPDKSDHSLMYYALIGDPAARKAEMQKISDSLGRPLAMYTRELDDFVEYFGVWKLYNGEIMSIRRKNNGLYDPREATIYTKEQIQVLNAVLKSV